jgi:hypothetical protein
MSLTIPGTGPLVLPTGTTVLANPAQFDVSAALASTSFVQQSLGNLRGSLSISPGPLTLGPAHWGRRLELQIGAALTLPLASSVPEGTSVIISTNQGASTITTTGGNILAFNNTGVAVPYTISNGATFMLINDGGVWRATLGSEELRTSSLFSASLTGGTGYQKLPSGLIMQWGLTNPSSGSADVLTGFPIAFPNAVRFINIFVGSVGTPYIATMGSLSTTNFGSSVWVTNTGARTAASVCYYLAIGY